MRITAVLAVSIWSSRPPFLSDAALMCLSSIEWSIFNMESGATGITVLGQNGRGFRRLDEQ